MWNIIKKHNPTAPEPAPEVTTSTVTHLPVTNTTNIKENIVMSTPVVTPVITPVATVPPAPVNTVAKVSGLQKFENVLTHIAGVLEKIQNGIVNVAEAEKPVIQQLLPSGLTVPLYAIIDHIAGQLASVDARYAAIGQQTVPYATKVAEVVATSGALYVSSLASGGISLGTMTINELVAGLGVVGNLNLATITAAPVVTPTPAA